MNKDQVKGKVKQVEGEVIDQKGDFTNDPEDDLRGKAKKAEGQIQEAWGNAKKAVADATDDRR